MWSKLVDLIPGLGQIKLSMTAVIWIVAALAFAGLGTAAYLEYKHIASLEQTVGSDATQIQGLKDANDKLQKQNDLLQKSGQINNTVSSTDVQQKQDATNATNAIATSTDNTVNTIIKKYQPQGPSQVITPAQQTQESRDLDEANIDGAWQTFCAAVPTEKACAQVPAKAAPAKAASSTDAVVGPVASNN
jgi:hypothetical protein